MLQNEYLQTIINKNHAYKGIYFPIYAWHFVFIEDFYVFYTSHFYIEENFTSFHYSIMN